MKWGFANICSFEKKKDNTKHNNKYLLRSLHVESFFGMTVATLVQMFALTTAEENIFLMILSQLEKEKLHF